MSQRYAVRADHERRQYEVYSTVSGETVETFHYRFVQSENQGAMTVEKIPPIYICIRGESDETAWEKVCHSREPFITIHHFPTYDTSRWVSKDRKRPYTIWFSSGRSCSHTTWSRHATLDAARKAAARLAASKK